MYRVSEDKQEWRIQAWKEVGYILLLVTFFVGIVMGTASLKKVSDSSFEEYAKSLEEKITWMEHPQEDVFFEEIFWTGVKTIGFFWVAGMSLIRNAYLGSLLGI